MRLENVSEQNGPDPYSSMPNRNIMQATHTILNYLVEKKKMNYF